MAPAMGSSESMVPTVQPSALLAMNSGAGGMTMGRSPAAPAATKPTSEVTISPVDQRQPRARHTGGVSATTASQAAISSAAKGGTPTSGSARFNAPNMETRKKT